MKEQGAYLEQWPAVQEAVEQHWAYEGVKTLRDLGLVYGGYQNDYRLNEPITAKESKELILGLWQQHRVDNISWVDAAPTCRAILTEAANTAGLEGDAVTALTEAGILTEQLQPYFADENKVPNRAEVIMLLSNVHQYLQ